MDQLIPGLAALVEAFRDVFHPRVFSIFQSLIAGGIVCLGPHTISEAWQATGTGLAARRHHDTACAVFHSACWEWDDVGIVLATLILAHLVLGGAVWVAVDGTLSRKRGAKVAFGGIFLDAVMSSKGHKTFMWYCVKGQEGSHVERERPSYEDRVMPTFTDMLGALRLQMWEFKVCGESGEELPSPECIRKLLHKLSPVA